jgi:hypothetical protein
MCNSIDSDNVKASDRSNAHDYTYAYAYVSDISNDITRRGMIIGKLMWIKMLTCQGSG